MKALIQRVGHASVRVDGELIGACGRGLLVLLAIERGDDEPRARRLAERVANYRVFPGSDDRMDRSAVDERAAALVISQFTLAADTRKGRRPSFDRAAPPDRAAALYGAFVDALRVHGLAVGTGRFGARMAVELENDGPVTFLLEERAAAEV